MGEVGPVHLQALVWGGGWLRLVSGRSSPRASRVGLREWAVVRRAVTR